MVERPDRGLLVITAEAFNDPDTVIPEILAFAEPIIEAIEFMELGWATIARRAATNRQHRKERSMHRKLMALFALAAVLVGLGGPAGADPQGFVEDEFEYGFFYGTFDQTPNVALFAGGTLEEFCFTDPGAVPLRVFSRNDGTVDLKVNDKDQPIYLYYETDFGDDVDPIPTWLDAICPGIASGETPPPEPFATGTADLKVRISIISDDLLKIFNSVNGKATGTDGTEYKVRGTADLIVENGAPVGEPRDFVGFKLTEIRR